MRMNWDTVWRRLLAVALAGAALGSATLPVVWNALDALHQPAAARIRYLWFWLGLWWVTCHVKSMSGRFFGYAGVFAGMLTLWVLSPSHDIGVRGRYTDYSVIFNRAIFWATVLFFAAGLVVWLSSIRFSVWQMMTIVTLVGVELGLFAIVTRRAAGNHPLHLATLDWVYGVIVWVSLNLAVLAPICIALLIRNRLRSSVWADQDRRGA
jgi:hypothetical protein